MRRDTFFAYLRKTSSLNMKIKRIMLATVLATFTLAVSAQKGGMDEACMQRQAQFLGEQLGLKEDQRAMVVKRMQAAQVEAGGTATTEELAAVVNSTVRAYLAGLGSEKVKGFDQLVEQDALKGICRTEEAPAKDKGRTAAPRQFNVEQTKQVK